MTDPVPPVVPLPTGLYEQIITRFLEQTLSKMPAELQQRQALDPHESAYRLAAYMQRLLAEALQAIKGDRKPQRQVEVCNGIIASLLATGYLDEPAARIAPGADELLAILPPGPGGSVPAGPRRPETPLSMASLLTGTGSDPTMVSQIQKEIESADQVDILCSFIKWHGINILINSLQQFVSQNNSQLRVITTTYIGATDLKAVELLHRLANSSVRISYDTRRTRLHAKAYVFRRASGFGTAFIGSANLSHAALTEGLEWNVKISQYEQPYLWDKVIATFETYWNDPEFVLYDHTQCAMLAGALRGAGTDPQTSTPAVYFDLRPYAFQQEILDHLDAERQIQGCTRQLVVAATGTGKTMIAAFDFLRFCTKLPPDMPRPRLLFVAHREEILKQSQYTFRMVLRDHNFGDLLVNGRDEGRRDHLFASIQSYNSRELFNLPANHFDYIVVDEFHHASAQSYQRLLSHVQPKLLLGLTATPERADGLDILKYFDGNISSEIRLPDAINRKLLCPFQYFGISDSVDLSTVRWKRGGYDREQLDGVFTGNDIRAQLVIDQVRSRLLDANRAKGLAFCVSIAHAEFMAAAFNKAGIPAAALSAESSAEHRGAIQANLLSNQICFIFCVDLYNEGIDIPAIDTVLFLRPTESLTVFLQQLGRGLRLRPGKDCLTVLDFIGRASRSFRFDLRFRALLPDATGDLTRQVQNGFPFLPAGCSIQLERQAAQHVLENIRRSVRNPGSLAGDLRNLAATLRRPPTLYDFITICDVAPREIYRRRVTFSHLCVTAGLAPALTDPDEAAWATGLFRISAARGPRQIDRLQYFIKDHPLEPDRPIAQADHQLLTMAFLTLWNGKPPFATVEQGLRRLRLNPALAAELYDLLGWCRRQIDISPEPIDLPFPCPLELHAVYTRDEILAGLGDWTLDVETNREFREGVRHIRALPADIFLFTLDKSERDYSPTTMYQDYAISDRLVHWQSQSTTSDHSETGRRYIQHQMRQHTIMLFARERGTTGGIANPYYFLGPADYDSHNGSRPISFIWKLRHALPAKLARRFIRMAAG